MKSLIERNAKLKLRWGDDGLLIGKKYLVGRFVDSTAGSLEIPYLTVSIFSSKHEAKPSAKE